MDDRRTFPRLEAGLNLAVYGKRGSYLCRLLDISESGLSFHSPATWELGEELTIAWASDATKSRFQVLARVSRLDSQDVGVEFVSLSPADRLSITTFVRRHALAS